MTVFRRILSILVLPVMMALVIPAFIVSSSSKRFEQLFWYVRFPGSLFLVLPGLIFLCAGLLLSVNTIALFWTGGEGTLAPWDPPQKMVVRGVYRFVRNPMISGIFFILIAECFTLGSLAIILWAFAFGLVNFIYIPLVEEPGLEQRFGESYKEYKRNVPRWIPRRTPWQG